MLLSGPPTISSQFHVDKVMIRRKLRTLRDLSGSDLWKVAGAWALLLAVDLGLRALSFRRVLQLLDTCPKHAGTERKGDPLPLIRRYRRAVEIAARNHLYPMLCLRRSLVLRWLLARQGVPTRLRLGVRRDEGKVAAHAWLEYEGRPVTDPPDVAERFATLAGPAGAARDMDL